MVATKLKRKLMTEALQDTPLKLERAVMRSAHSVENLPMPAVGKPSVKSSNAKKENSHAKSGKGKVTLSQEREAHQLRNRNILGALSVNNPANLAAAAAMDYSDEEEELPMPPKRYDAEDEVPPTAETQASGFDDMYGAEAEPAAAPKPKETKRAAARRGRRLQLSDEDGYGIYEGRVGGATKSPQSVSQVVPESVVAKSVSRSIAADDIVVPDNGRVIRGFCPAFVQVGTHITTNVNMVEFAVELNKPGEDPAQRIGATSAHLDDMDFVVRFWVQLASGKFHLAKLKRYEVDSVETAGNRVKVQMTGSTADLPATFIFGFKTACVARKFARGVLDGPMSV